ncbi:MAG: hypothetical protein COW85_06115 [Ignavibacteria bacterium CG22_combo_CG10-13_8_21_14_all_37_15]|nr:hypothetical protein [Ignavibacteria bacterium]OIO21504.1 MAG: hypothetical protein AUJ54_04725 [Ignavibacteria bacterium CG1_02_37_35]PIP77990.1 MAG: hypothetical protein COW85_06115 [Ignavibacteria bacterium CG22_combo_CG10-13_8_21_14_all_37_15]PIS45098.1 MAG: hypothetical protein COT22_07070 [Ignavibacteria bacterium CG08_land_8_20_14_0_20_37_9]PIX94721.1 MAG: hypothetical protein COZ25_04055 [Ignavibacteria bacterium CG_4_10_14_3_um_filter_37_18]
MRIVYSSILINFIFGLSLMLGQENPNVELPQFVITGKETYEFPPLEKQKPEVVSTVSEQFFKPVYSPDELEVKEFSEPSRRSGEFLDSINFVNGGAEFLIGNNILPSLTLRYRIPIERSILSANVHAMNQRAYLPNSDRNKYGAELHYNTIISDSSSFLPFSKFHASALAENESYKLFASPIPDFNRKIFRGNFAASLQNISSAKLNYDLTFEDNYLNMKSDSVNENIFKVNGYTKYTAKLFEVSLFGKYHALTSTYDPLSPEKYAFIQAKGIFGFPIGNSVKTNFGFEFSKLDSNKTISPYIAAAIQFRKGFSLFAEYHPTSSMITQQDLIYSNRYYSPDAKIKNIFYRVKSQYAFNFKYEYERAFEVICGFSLFSASGYPYFNIVSPNVNNFVVDIIEARGTTAFARINLYSGKYGFFVGDVLFQNVQDTSGNLVPNVTPINAEVTYGYCITPEISFSASMMYYSPAFLNFANTKKGRDYVNLTFKGEMNISEKMFAQLELRNILNSKNEIWKNYQELPLSISAGLKIIW